MVLVFIHNRCIVYDGSVDYTIQMLKRTVVYLPLLFCCIVCNGRIDHTIQMIKSTGVHSPLPFCCIVCNTSITNTIQRNLVINLFSFWHAHFL